MVTGVTVTRGFVIQSLARCFDAEGGDAAGTCRVVGLGELAHVSHGDVIPAEYYYKLLNCMTDWLSDPMFPARAGRAQARVGINALVDQRRASRTLGEFITRLQIAYRQALDSGWYVLRSDGNRATFEIERKIAPTAPYANVETLNAAAWITILQDEIGEEAHSDLKVALPDPSAMPHDVLDPRSCFKAKDGRMKLSFPADWLTADLNAGWSAPHGHVDGDLRPYDGSVDLDPLRYAVGARLREGEVKVDDIASWLGLSPRSLQRNLANSGQTFRRIVREERSNRAADLLRSSDKSINEISFLCGFSSAQAFARSFRSSFGLSPSDYRASKSDKQT